MGRRLLKTLTSPIRNIRERRRERREEAAGATQGRGGARARGATPQITGAIPDPGLGLEFPEPEPAPKPKPAPKPAPVKEREDPGKKREGGSQSGSGSLKKKKSNGSGSRSSKSNAGVKKSASKKSSKSKSLSSEKSSTCEGKGKKPASKASTDSFESAISNRFRGEVSLSGYFEGRYTEFRPVQTRRGLGQSLPVLELESSGHKAPESEGSSDSTWKPKRASSTIEDWFEKDSSKLREELQERGIEMARWIEDPGAANCPTTQCNMSRQDLIQATGGVVYESPVYRPFGQIEYSLYLPPVEVLPRQDGDYKTLNAEGRNIKCNTVMSKYIIIIENVFRDPPEDEPNYPHISESVVTMFNTTFETTEMLRYIFVSTVVNLQTRDYIDNVLYPDGYESIPEYQQGAPDREADYPKPDYFARGTPAYQEILGTRIGRMVGSIVLAAFPRGTRRITGIHIWTCTGGMQFRFDLRSN